MYKTIVVGTDGSPTARHAVDQAIVLAETFGAELHVAVGFRPPSQAYAGGGDAPLGPLPTDEDVRQVIEVETTEQVAAAAEGHVDYEMHLIPGGGAHAILEVAEAVKADLIVVGSRGMTGVRRMLGSVPNNVAHHAHCSVLIVDTAD